MARLKEIVEQGEASSLAVGRQGVPRLTILVVSYNTREMTLNCLRSVETETRIPYEIIVMDNASTDGSAEAISSEFPHIRLFAETENHGFAKANNLLAKHARGEFLLMLNPDTIVLDCAIDALVEFAGRRPEAQIWGGRTLYGDYMLNPSSVWRRMTNWGLFCQVFGLNSLFRGSALFNPEGYGGWPRDSEREVDIVQGCFLLIRRAFWEELRGFDAAFIMYGEESDLCLRARALGARPRFTPDAQIIHYAGASEKVRAERMIRQLRAKVLLIRRHFPAWQQPFALAAFRLWPLSRAYGNRLLCRPGAETWHEIWRRRAEWWEGWPDAAD